MCMRTNIVLDDDLLRQARTYSSAKTKRALVDEALRTFIRVKETESRLEACRRDWAELQPLLDEIVLDEDPVEALRRDRESH
jgi:Arc/MetJ family transcription regulator